VLRHRPDRIDQVPAGIAFADIALRPGIEYLLDDLFRAISAVDDYFRFGRCSFDLTNSSEAVEVGHRHVQHDYIGLRSCRGGNRLASIPGDAANLEARLTRK